MLAVRIAFASLAAPLIATLPYLAFAYFGLTSFAVEGGAPAQGVLTGAFLVLIGALLAALFLGLARVRWKKRSMVVRQHLSGWPIGFAALFLLLFAVPGWLEGPKMFSIVLLTAGTSGFVGAAAVGLWLRLSYANEEEG